MYFTAIKKTLIGNRKKERERKRKQEGRKGQSQQLHRVYRDTLKHNSPEKIK